VTFFSKNILANLSSNIWLVFLSIVLTPLYVWFLGIESYGLIGFYLSWVSILGILDAGVSSTATREMAWHAARPEGKEKIPSLLLSLEVVYWSIILVLGVGILLGAWFLGAEWFQVKELSPEVIRQVLILMAISLVVQVPSGLYVAGMMGLQRQVECSGLLGLFGTLRGLGAVLVLWLINPDIRAFFVWQILASALQTGMIRWSLWKLVSKDGHHPRFSLQILKSLKGFAGGMILITTLGVLISQADKIILSRLVSLEDFGYYMLAWTVASGFSRISGPLTQAFYPRFTELVSKGDFNSLSNQFRIISQLMSVLILPPCALIVFLSNPIIFVWTGNQVVADGVTPILVVLAIGTVLSVSSHPAACILYSKKDLKPVIIINMLCFLALLPLLIVTVINFGVMGGAYIWGLYGLILYISCFSYGFPETPNLKKFLQMVKDFFVPGTVSFIFFGFASNWLNNLNGKVVFVILVSFVLILGWLITLFVCKDLRQIVLEKMNWKLKPNH
jgi:O-antigen/teichoic acid export membrane protein